MKRKRFNEEQIIGILQEAQKGVKTIGELCRVHGVSEPTFYTWRRKYETLCVPEVRRLRELKKENGRLKKLVVERDLEIDVLREMISKK
jgi:putative transposase